MHSGTGQAGPANQRAWTGRALQLTVINGPGPGRAIMRAGRAGPGNLGPCTPLILTKWTEAPQKPVFWNMPNVFLCHNHGIDLTYTVCVHFYKMWIHWTTINTRHISSTSSCSLSSWFTSSCTYHLITVTIFTLSRIICHPLGLSLQNKISSVSQILSSNLSGSTWTAVTDLGLGPDLASTAVRFSFFFFICTFVSGC